MRFLCLWACKSGSLEDFTNTLKAEALFLVFWFKALSSFLLPLVTTINDLSFYFWPGCKLFQILFVFEEELHAHMCWCACMCTYMEVRGIWSSAANQQSPGILLSPSPTHCAGVIGKHVAVDVEDSNSGLAHSMISPGPIFKTFCSDNFCAWFTL